VKRLDLLVFKAVMPAVIMACVVFAGFDSLLALLNELDEIGIGEYDMLRVLEYVALTVPRRLYQMFSTAAIVGTMMGLGALAARSELVALQAAGASRTRIGQSAVFAVACLLVVALLLGEWIGPRADRMAQDLAAQSKAEGIAFSGSGLWLRDGKAVWNAKRVVTTGPGQLDLWEVWRYQFGEDARLQEVIKAERASFSTGHFELRQLSRDSISDAQIVSVQEDSHRVETLLDPALIESHTVRPRQQGTADLAETIRYARVNQLDALAFESAYWFRVFYPLVCLALAFAAVPFAFGNQRSGGAGQRLLLGMALGIGFYFGQRTLINLAETNQDGLILVNAVPPLLLIAITWWALRRPAR
jgi:lipopolysaccharide export system permease protein